MSCPLPWLCMGPVHGTSTTAAPLEPASHPKQLRDVVGFRHAAWQLHLSRACLGLLTAAIPLIN